ncbi:MAG: restriction endonuclease [Ignavibacteria bacterium]|nr:restriction endonuclease [Ignavibacteria bacterium]
MQPYMPIGVAGDLVTPKEKIRAGFIALTLEKNHMAVPYIEEAKTLKYLCRRGTKPEDLLGVKDVRVDLSTTSDDFINELVYRYLLTKGDALGGKARNLAGVLGERKFLRSLLSVFNLSGIDYQWKDDDTDTWLPKPQDDTGIEKRINGMFWTKNRRHRLLIMNVTVPVVKKNVDLSILEGTINDLGRGKQSLIHDIDAYVALGELKGGIDPAGADEHWKTANSALERIRKSFSKKKKKPQTFFIGAAIENSMASEIFKQLRNGSLNNAANLTNDEQLASICEWILNL